MTLDQGYTIRGNDGVDVYFHEGAYVVEHFHLVYSGDVRIIWRSEPFQTRAEANDEEERYRRRYGQ